MGNRLMREEYVQGLPQAITDNLQHQNDFIIETICKRIGEIGTLSLTDVHRLIAANLAGADLKEIEMEIARITKLNLAEIDRIFEQVGEDNAQHSKPLFAFKNLPFVPFEQNGVMQSMVYAMAKITKNEYINLSRTAGFIGRDGKPRSIRKQYITAIDRAITEVSTGVLDYKTAMRQTIKEMANSGYRTIDYETGYSRRLDTAVRQNILTGVKDISHEMQSDIGQAVGSDGYEISYHANPRPSHVAMGGEQYTRKEFLSQGIDRLLQDYNCYHIAFDIIIGVSPKNFSNRELAQLKASDNKPREWLGQPIGGYEATQRQRKYETKIRHLKDEANAYKAAGDDLARRQTQSKINSVSAEYARFSGAVGLSVKQDRKSVAGFRRVRSLTNSSGGGTMKVGRDDKMDILPNNGAYYGALNPDSREAYKHAETYYEAVRNMKSDCKSIAINTGWDEQAITDVKNHIFIDKHNLGRREPCRFDPDYHMAQSWQRLIDGDDIQEMDIILLQHESMELKLMKGQGMSYRQAHEMTDQKYNYSNYVKRKVVSDE